MDEWAADGYYYDGAVTLASAASVLAVSTLASFI